MSTAEITVGEALIALLEQHGVEIVFGIPGVHTIELYRGLARSAIRHITPRHEQGAGFMADGYARISGRPGVAFVITGPGLTNTITAMAQARADSVPMLVISGVNALPTLGKGMGHLHELPDQLAMLRTVALKSDRIERGEDLAGVLGEAFALLASGRPGPVHIEIPTNVMVLKMARPVTSIAPVERPHPTSGEIAEAVRLAEAATKIVILAGGGAKTADAALRDLAERLDAPVVLTTNGRGLMHRHPLCVPASPSLKPVRDLIAEADLVIAAGTEFGPTDYDMYGDGGWRAPANLIRIDIDEAQLRRWPSTVALQGDAGAALEALAEPIPPRDRGDGAQRAKDAREAAWAALSPAMQSQIRVLETIRDALPGAIVVGDSTQAIYAGNLWYDHDRPGGWFNAATGYGALGFGPPAAIGAALADPGAPVVCLTGDGGFQFTLAEIGAALDSGASVIFLVWNNRGYREIETSMLDAGVEPVGVSPAPPDFVKVADAFGLSAERLGSLDELSGALRRARATGAPALIEIGPDLTF